MVPHVFPTQGVNHTASKCSFLFIYIKNNIKNVTWAIDGNFFKLTCMIFLTLEMECVCAKKVILHNHFNYFAFLTVLHEKISCVMFLILHSKYQKLICVKSDEIINFIKRWDSPSPFKSVEASVGELHLLIALLHAGPLNPSHLPVSSNDSVSDHVMRVPLSLL